MPKKEKLDISEKNIIEVESLDFGDFIVILSDYQVEDMLERGAKVLVDFQEDIENNLEDVENKEDWYITDDYLSDPDSMNAASIDWGAIFPDIDSRDLEASVQYAMNHDDDSRYKTAENLTVLSVGIASAMGANGGPPALGVISICDVSGSFFKD